MTERPVWRRASPDDLDAVMAIQDVVHALTPERRIVMAERMALGGEACQALADARGDVLGYGFAIPFRLDDAPPLDGLIGVVPADPECLYVHDVALLPSARGQGAGRRYIAHATEVARGLHLPALTLISVYGTWPLWQALGFELREVPRLADKLAPFGDTARYMVKQLG